MTGSETLCAPLMYPLALPQVSSMWEYLILYFQLANADRKLKFLSLYISELTLLHVDFGQYPLALQAASVFYLAQIISSHGMCVEHGSL